MECVVPIKDKAHIEAMYQVLQQQSQRDYLLLSFAIHTGVKLSTLLSLRVADVVEHHRNEADDQTLHYPYPRHYSIMVKSAIPEIVVLLPSSLRQALAVYISQGAALSRVFFSSRAERRSSCHVSRRIVLFIRLRRRLSWRILVCSRCARRLRIMLIRRVLRLR